MVRLGGHAFRRGAEPFFVLTGGGDFRLLALLSTSNTIVTTM